MRDPVPAPINIARIVTPLAQTLSLRTLPLHAHEILPAFAFYNFLNLYVSPTISSKLARRTYPDLPERSRINWDAHVVSLVQSTFINTAALWVIWSDRERWEMSAVQRVWGYTGSMGMVQACSAGYFLWDLISASLRPDVHGYGAIAHAAAAVAISMLGFRPFCNYYGINFVLYELSTPFLNFHWFMDKLDMTGSTAQLINGIALLVTFGGSRLVWGTYQNVKMYSDIWEAFNTQGGLPVPTWLAGVYMLASGTLTGLNLFWFSKMIQALLARFQDDKKSDQKKKR
ncbi:uncharacterized protein KY384_001986 [Bacidia gigantensis]|uniref:uncharacterized protein n=1 Tax=Bacidia gigantensis TaxID=2732470 RepID=UPI001D059600|nr:uncharacterized protein KY384_001986 [Bacidia gigantensis]KAG8533203.1 hypothetical protein KY384_001986 [Bacidia gigantensis]